MDSLVWYLNTHVSPVPPLTNPADFLLDVLVMDKIDPGLCKQQHVEGDVLVQDVRVSAAKVREQTDLNVGQGADASKYSKAWLHQTKILIERMWQRQRQQVRLVFGLCIYLRICVLCIHLIWNILEFNEWSILVFSLPPHTYNIIVSLFEYSKV